MRWPKFLSQAAALHASYAVSLELAKAKKHFSDGTLVKKCAEEMAKAFGEMKIAEKFETDPCRGKQFNAAL